jgi:hypothetical protein
MKLEDQVVSLELAKKLKEPGVKQESAFWWNLRFNSGEWHLDSYQIFTKSNASPCDDSISAFTVAELGEILPKGYVSYRSPNGVDGWFCWVDQTELLGKKPRPKQTHAPKC